MMLARTAKPLLVLYWKPTSYTIGGLYCPVSLQSAAETVFTTHGVKSLLWHNCDDVFCRTGGFFVLSGSREGLEEGNRSLQSSHLRPHSKKRAHQVPPPLHPHTLGHLTHPLTTQEAFCLLWRCGRSASEFQMHTTNSKIVRRKDWELCKNYSQQDK